MKINIKLVFRVLEIGLLIAICTDIVLLIIHDHSKIQQINRIMSIVTCISLFLFCIQKGITWIISLGFDLIALSYCVFSIYQVISKKVQYESITSAVFVGIAEIFVIIEIVKYLKTNSDSIHF